MCHMVANQRPSMQHYQKDADGLCTRLKQAVDVSGSPPSVVSRKEFEKRMSPDLMGTDMLARGGDVMCHDISSSSQRGGPFHCRS